MGAVYRAWDTNLGEPVAIKENLDAWPEAGKRFLREAKILMSLSHPNLPSVSDYFFIEGQGQYLVVEYADGEDLSVTLERKGTINEEQAIEWISQVCEALSYLHQQSPPIIHSDIKPANIKIRPDGRAMLVDFGIAKSHDSLMKTAVGAHSVTPGYSPPEQYSEDTIDERADIYALGATLYHLLSGESPPESVHRISGSVEMPKPRSLNAQISPKVEQVILKATAVSPDDRFKSISEFRAALMQPADTEITRSVTPLAPREEQSTEQDQIQEIPTPLKIRRKRFWVSFLISAVIVLCLLLGVLLASRSFSVFLAPLTEPDPAITTTDQLIIPSPSVPETPLVFASPTPEGVYILNIQAWVTNLLFYEGSQGNLPTKNTRVYGDRFPISSTRTVYWELNLTHPTTDERINFSIRSVLIDSDGTVLDDVKIDTYRDTDWTYSWHTSGWGWDEPGLWQDGEYKVELYIDEQLVASGFFEIYP